MTISGRRIRLLIQRSVCWLFLVSSGCAVVCKPDAIPDAPHEYASIPQPPYVIEAPDVLLVDAVRLIPKPPYKVAPLDVLGIQVTNTLPEQPIQGLYSVDTEGTVNLGFNYGSVRLEGMTLAEAKTAIEKYMKTKLKPPYEVTVILAEGRALQQIRGPHIVRIDGTIGLGVYGSVLVDNMTIEQAKANIERHLSEYLLNPEISLDVSGFNSKVFYVITDGAGAGEQVVRLPMQGKTTVLDAISQVNGLSPVSSKHHLSVVRPAPSETGGEVVLPVDWNGIVRRGETATNYQVMPGDRIYVRSSPLVTADTELARGISPLERLFGIVTLGNSSVRLFLTPIPTNIAQNTTVP